MFSGRPNKAQHRDKQSRVDEDLALHRARRFSLEPETCRIWAIVIATFLCLAFTLFGLVCLMAKLKPLMYTTFSISGM